MINDTWHKTSERAIQGVGAERKGRETEREGTHSLKT